MNTECDHKWNYFKVVRNKSNFVNCVKRECIRCGEKQFVRRLDNVECRHEGVFKI